MARSRRGVLLVTAQRFDRIEPVPGPPAPPRSLARLGEVMRLPQVPADLTPADCDPRPCRGCADWVLRPGLAYCDACRHARCPTCHGRNGQHAAGCRPATCHTCGVRIEGAGFRYCAACKAQQCPECQRYGGRHGRFCRYASRRRRDAPREKGPYLGVVTEQDVIDVFVHWRPRAVRLARAIVGELWAEDVVQDAFLYFVERRDELREVPTVGYLLKAVRHRAYMWLQPLVRQRMVAVDPEELVHLEALMFALAQGRPRTPEVSFAGAEPG
jgi:Sigma-70 region 2